MDCTPDRCVLSEEGNGKAGPAWTALQIDVSLKQGRQWKSRTGMDCTPD